MVIILTPLWRPPDCDHNLRLCTRAPARHAINGDRDIDCRSQKHFLFKYRSGHLVVYVESFLTISAVYFVRDVFMYKGQC